MKKIIIISIASLLFFCSCEDKNKDEYNQIKKDLEQLNKEKQELEDKTKELEAEEKALIIENQQFKVNKVVDWYFKVYIYRTMKYLQFGDYTTKNVFDEANLKKTIITFREYEAISHYSKIKHQSTQQILNHTLNDEGMVIKSECDEYTIDWNWENASELKIVLKLKGLDKRRYELKINEHNQILREDVYYPHGQRDFCFEYEYNDANLYTKIERYNSKNEKSESYIYSYNEQYNITQYKIVKGANEYLYTYTYDADGRITRIYTSKDYKTGKENEILIQYNEQ